ncbi:MAG: hypothetical protein ACM3JG_08830 [Thiohalocapsa sp.]
MLLLLTALRPGEAAAECRTLPPAVPDRVGRAQIFVHGLKDKAVLRGKRDIIWGDYGDKVPNIYSMTYMAADRDPNHQHQVDWYRANHPDWVMYKCDRKSPAHSFHYDYGYDTPVDIADPAVRQYLWDANPDLAQLGSRYEADAVDNVQATNDFGRCGVWHGGVWVQRYSGGRGDPGYAHDVAAWMKWLGERVHAAGACLAANHYFGGLDLAGFKEVAAELDIIVDEHGFTRGCKPMVSDDAWRQRIALFRDLARSKPVVIIDQVCPTEAGINRAVLDWSLANYLLLKGERSYLAIVPENKYGQLQDFPELYLETGLPQGDFTVERGVYVRHFAKALALVNPSSKAAASYDLGERQWRDLDGKSLTGRLELPPGTARVLVPATPR